MNIIIYHNGKQVTAITPLQENEKFIGKEIEVVCVQIAKIYSEAMLFWCHENLKEQLNVSSLHDIVHHNKMMVSYNPSETDFFGDVMGYVEFSPYININKSVRYPTWIMSSCVGAVHASTINLLNNKLATKNGFDYFLNSIAKLAMPKGLICYSDPNLLLNNDTSIILPKATKKQLFKFVREHFVFVHYIFLLLNILLYQKQFPFLTFLYNIGVKRKTIPNNILDAITVNSNKKVITETSVDVVIPTIGRKKYLYDVLQDFTKQTVLPKKIIIVEQHPDKEKTSELDYLQNQDWPFEIKHIFTHTLGVCNARNVALDEATSEWIYMADDDIRFDSHFIENIFERISQYGNEVMTSACPQKNEPTTLHHIIQWATFGTGNSFVKRSVLGNHVRFNMALEFGYGEDKDFGMQLRNQGADIIYLPEPKILHLKAPVGGFRFKHIKPWQDDAVFPKPSPTVLLFYLSHYTRKQFLGYKTTYLLKRILKQPFRINSIKKEWNRSLFWVDKLMN